MIENVNLSAEFKSNLDVEFQKKPENDPEKWSAKGLDQSNNSQSKLHDTKQVYYLAHFSPPK